MPDGDAQLRDIIGNIGTRYWIDLSEGTLAGGGVNLYNLQIQADD